MDAVQVETTLASARGYALGRSCPWLCSRPFLPVASVLLVKLEWKKITAGLVLLAA
jgi:hypothetical protein